MSASNVSTYQVLPRQPAPPLEVELLAGGTYRLTDQTPDRFTMVVFYRGLHCPVCRGQLSELDSRLDELSERGIEVIAASVETKDRTQQVKDDWELEHLTLAYGLTEAAMRSWDLYVSKGMGDAEPPLFNEPGLFLIAPDTTVFCASILSMPVGRPKLDDLLMGIDFWTAEDYPARGEA